MKLNIILHYFIAWIGFLAIARVIFGVSDAFVFVGMSSVFVLNSFFSLQISEGHTWILPAAYIPFAYLGFEHYLRHRRLRAIILGAAAFALMVWSAGVYPAPYTALFLCAYAGARVVLERTTAPLKALVLFGGYAFLFSAVKLVPVVDYMISYPRIAGHREGIPLGAWPQIFFSRDQTLYSAHTFSGKVFGWHEYGCYIGMVYALLIILAALRILARVPHSRRQPRELSLVLCLLGFLALFAGDFAYMSPYRILSRLPVFSSMYGTGRFLIIITFISALLLLELGHALIQELIQRPVLKTAVYALCVLLVVDLVYVNSAAFKDAFPIDRSILQHQNGPLQNADSYIAVNDLPRYGHVRVRSSMYAGLLWNRYVVDCYEPVRPVRGFELASPLVFSRDPGILVSRIRFTPNRVTFDVDAAAKARVYLNQNYVRGWSLTGTDATINKDEYKPSFLLLPGSYRELSFYFLPKSIVLGLGLTAIGIIGAALHLVHASRDHP
jgi:hypothetical protein